MCGENMKPSLRTVFVLTHWKLQGCISV